MKSNFVLKNIKEVADVFAGGDKPKKISKKWSADYPIPIYANGETNDGLQGYTDKARVIDPAVTISARGTIGYVVLRKEPFLPIVRLLTLTPKPNVMDIHYLYYYLKLYRQAGLGSSQAQLTVPDIANRKIMVPDIETQKSIGATLSAIDNKITLNNQIAREIENLLKLVYEYWFVQFDFPGENGKPYKSSGCDLTYDKSLNRGIPSIWKAGKLKGYLELLKDGTHNPTKRVPEGVPLLTGTMFDSNFLVYDDATYISYEDYCKIHAKYKPEVNDIIITKIGTVGTVNLLTEHDLPIAIHCNSAIVRAKNLEQYPFVFMMLKSKEFQGHLKKNSTKTIQEFINLEKLGDIPVLMPDDTIVNKFTKLSLPYIEKLKSIYYENRNLEELRDWLLPMLVTGQIKVGR